MEIVRFLIEVIVDIGGFAIGVLVGVILAIVVMVALTAASRADNGEE